MSIPLLSMSLLDLKMLRSDRHTKHLFSLREATTLTDFVELVREREVRQCPSCQCWWGREHFIESWCGEEIADHDTCYECCKYDPSLWDEDVTDLWDEDLHGRPSTPQHYRLDPRREACV